MKLPDTDWILLCDDEEEMLRREKALLRAYAGTHPDFALPVRTWKRLADLLKENFRGSRAPVIAFIDGQMESNRDGLEAVRYLRKSRPEVLTVLVTGYNSAVDRGMDVHIDRVIKKPFDDERYFDILDQIRRKLEVQRGIVRFPGTEEPFDISSADILMAEAERKNCRLITKEGEKTAAMGIGECEDLLKPHGFFRTHRTALVNMAYVEDFDRKRVVLQTENGAGEPVSVTAKLASRTRYEEFRMALLISHRMD